MLARLSSNIETAERLFRLGFLTVNHAEELRSPCPKRIHEATLAYARFHGLSEDTDVYEHMARPRFCGHPDVMMVQAGGICKWGKTNIAVCISGSLPGLSQSDFAGAVQMALNYWQAVSGLTFSFTDSPSNADLLIQTGPIPGDPGAGGVLAQCELPCGATDRRLGMLVDNRETWVIAENWSGMKIDLVRVLCHEFGHGFGLEHTSVANQLMNPVISQTIRKPQPAWDIPEIQKRYPQKTPAPTPTPVPTPTPLVASIAITGPAPSITVNGTAWGPK